MEKIELHFIHGFLGRPEDWQNTINGLPKTIKVYCHDLVKDFSEIPSSQASFTQWAAIKKRMFSDKSVKRVLVGYSLGGRLAMHLDPRDFEHIILIAAHPGLSLGKEERRQVDDDWASRLRDGHWADWIKQWNKQEIFSNDLTRPDRSHVELNKKVWSEILQAFSLAEQDMMDTTLSSNREKFYWLFGQRDLKYAKLESRIIQAIGKDHVIEVETSGHGVPFDNASELAKILTKVVQDVE